ncbi:MAG: hypothetical protein ACFB0D_15120 [Phormidesmis sp.]
MSSASQAMPPEMRSSYGRAFAIAPITTYHHILAQPTQQIVVTTLAPNFVTTATPK